MKGVFCVLVSIGVVAGSGFAAPAPGGQGVDLSLGGNLLILNMEGGDSTTLAGVAVRVDLGLGRLVFVAPELSAGFGGWTAGGTLNVQLSRFFAGAGALAVGATEGGSGGEWGTNAFFKLHAGLKSARSLLAVSYLAGDYIDGFGLTVAWVF